MYAARKYFPQTWHGTLSSWQARCERSRSRVAKEALHVCGQQQTDMSPTGTQQKTPAASLATGHRNCAEFSNSADV